MSKYEVLQGVLVANGYVADESMAYGQKVVSCYHPNRNLWASVIQTGTSYGVSTSGSMICVDDAYEYIKQLNKATELANILNNILAQQEG